MSRCICHCHGDYDQMADLCDHCRFATTKPDGWHTYHVCGGQIREITRVTDEDNNASLTCAACGEWFDCTVTPEELAKEIPA